MVAGTKEVTVPIWPTSALTYWYVLTSYTWIFWLYVPVEIIKKILVTIMLNKVHLRSRSNKRPWYWNSKHVKNASRSLQTFCKMWSLVGGAITLVAGNQECSVPLAASGQEDCPSHCRATLLAGGWLTLHKSDGDDRRIKLFLFIYLFYLFIPPIPSWYIVM